MVIYLQQGDPSLAQGLSMLGQGLGQYQKRQQQQSVLQDVLGSLPENATQQNILQAALEAAKKGVPFEAFSSLAKLFPKPIVPGRENKSFDEYVDLYKRAGLSDEESNKWAALSSSSSTGGQTQIIKNLGDVVARQGEIQQVGPMDAMQQQGVQLEAMQQQGSPMEAMQQQQAAQQASPQQQEKQSVYSFINENFRGLTPKERAAKSTNYEEKNDEVRLETSKFLRESANTKSSLDRMQTLNKKGGFPSVLSRPFVLNKDGSLRAPEITDPKGHIQEYTKLTNAFQKNAKNYYGSQVSGFELESFKTMLPTLSNSQAGRERIINSMKIQTEIDDVIRSEIKNIYDEYGVRSLSRSQVEQLAEKRSAPKLEKLRKDFQEHGVGDSVLMEINGKKGLVPSDKVEAALKKGYKKV